MMEAMQSPSTLWIIIGAVVLFILYKNGYLDNILKPKAPPVTPSPVLPPVPGPLPLPPGPVAPVMPPAVPVPVQELSPLPIETQKILTSAKLTEWCQANGVVIKQ